MHTVTFAVLTLTWASGTGECNSIRDFDRRQACIAAQDANPAECASLKDADARTLCRVRAQRPKQH